MKKWLIPALALIPLAVMAAIFQNTFTTDATGKFPIHLPIAGSQMAFVGQVDGDGTVYAASKFTFSSTGFFLDNATVTNAVSANSYQSVTNRWPGASANLDLTLGSQDYTASANCTVQNFANRSTTLEQTVLLNITNSTGSDITMTIPNPVVTPDGLRVYTVTNKSMRAFSFKYSPQGYTQMVTQPFF